MNRAKIVDIDRWDCFYPERFALIGKTVIMTESLNNPLLPAPEWIAGYFVLLEDAHPYAKAGEKICFVRVKLEFKN